MILCKFETFFFLFLRLIVLVTAVCALYFLSHDLFYMYWQRDAKELRGQTNVVTNNSYDMEDIVMPLHEYIDDPIAKEIVHNGATFQVLTVFSR